MISSAMKAVLQDSPSNTDDPRDAADENSPVSLERLPEPTGRELVQLFKLLSDETRLRIMYFLMQQEELNVRTLCDLLEQSQPAVSHHLALLRVAGIIECRRDGKHNFYHLVPKRFQHFLDMLFAMENSQPRRIRIENALLTYSHDGNAAAE
ncbi:ArsR/SmtB family transcription factor [Anatilimnocola sp. NA78]|uniref:ArsR/SmtB family transcription factor n=1 Tax=Anatilimnocola sp. NA78 TaxID=3415683 RepID=UPI003CE4DC36